MKWVYINSETNIWTVGFYSPDGRWHADTNHDNHESAQRQVHYLNGGNDWGKRKEVQSGILHKGHR